MLTTVRFESCVTFTYSWCCDGLIINVGVSSIKARCQEISEIAVSLMGLLLVNTVYAGVGDKQCTGPYIVDIINWPTCLMWLTNYCLKTVGMNCCSLYSDCGTRRFLWEVCGCTASQNILCFCKKNGRSWSCLQNATISFWLSQLKFFLKFPPRWPDTHYLLFLKV